jgi:glycosyltransferase involved in cell wall biosynthesis
MKILYYSTAYYSTHGGSNHSRAFVTYCRKHRYVTEIEVFPEQSGIIINRSEKKLKHFLKRIPIFQVIFFLRRNTFHLRSLKEKIKSFKPDVLHIRLDSNFLQIKRLRQDFPDIIISTEINATTFDESFRNIAFKNNFRELEYRSLMYADFNFFVSGYLRQHIMKQIKIERDFVVHNGVDLNLFSSNQTLVHVNNEREFTFIYVGTLDYHKRMHILIEAFRQINLKFPNTRLIVIGDGPTKDELIESAKAMGIAHSIDFHGWIAHDKIPQYLLKSDIAVHHFAEEYMSPLKLFEYMAMGIPVIAPSTPSVKEIITDGVHAILTNGESDDIKQKMLKLINDKDLRLKIAEYGSKLVHDKYSWHHNVDFIISKFKALL